MADQHAGADQDRCGARQRDQAADRDGHPNLNAALAIGDGALGLWAALDEVFPTARHQE